MTEVFAGFYVIAVCAGWLWSAVAVGKAAATKNRRRWLWTTMAFVPLGPVMVWPWLWSMPVAGQKATPGQVVGRAVLIFLVLLSLVAQVVQVGSQAEIKSKAESDFGYQTESKSVHYKKMAVEEIVICLQLNSEMNAMSDAATLDESEGLYLFGSQREADIYNSAISMHAELECDDRTYDVADLDEAMQQIERNEVMSISDKLIQRIDSVEAKISRWNAAAPQMVDASTRFDNVVLQQDKEVLTRFTLIDYVAEEVSQADLTEFFEPLLDSGSCSDPELADLRRNGYELTYEYRGRDGEYIGAITLQGTC